MSGRFILSALALVACVQSADAQTSGKFDPLAQARASHPTGHSRVIVRAQNAASLGLVSALVQQLGGTLGRQLLLIESVVADVPNAALTVLAGNAIVRRVALDRSLAGALDRTGGTIGSTLVREELGLDGSGVGVAVIDSGVTSWHDDLSGSVPGSQRIDQFVDFVNGQTTPYDDYGHGTHVAGIIAGNGYDSGGTRSGIAPGARLVVIKVLDGSGRGQISDVIAALDYAITNKDVFQLRVVNLSVAAGVYESYNSDLLTLAAKRAVDAGLIVVAAAGNVGRSGQGHTVYGAVGAPGNAPWVLTVGASSHQGTIDRTDDTIARFSSRGPTNIDRGAKPDLVAPGVGIESLSDPQSAMFTSKSPYLVDGSVATAYPPYLSLSGTSQATPVVAGTVALMLQANPALTANAVKAILQYTAEDYPDFDALTEGAGFLNARGAVQLARYFAQPATPYPATTGWSQQIIWGTHRIRSGVLTSTANAWGTSVAWGSPTTPTGQLVTWGTICSPPSNCSLPSAWAAWKVSCGDLTCGSYVWGSADAENVVWGTTCGGADCSSTSWNTETGNVSSTSDDGDTVVWGTSDDGDTVVWGTSDDDGDTVVWGTSDDGDTVVWGTSNDDDNIVWGRDNSSPPDTNCEESDSTPIG